MIYPFVFNRAYEGQVRFLLTLVDGPDTVTVDGWMNPQALANPDRRWRILRGMRDMLREEPTTPPRALEILRGLTAIAEIHVYQQDEVPS